jgi:hypothetical protein
MIDRILTFLKINRIRWHNFRSLKPASRKFGFDRGTPIDRYYIDQFLRSQAQLIKGKVIEVADNGYTRKHGSNVTSSEILHLTPGPNITLVADITDLDSVPYDYVDCFICTQVYNFVFDFHSAIRGSYQLLKPGGTLLGTVSGISPVSRYDAGRWGHYWSFYPQGIARAFQDVFGNDHVEIHVYGNSLTAAAFVKGISAEELSLNELDYLDSDYPVTIAIKATKLFRR